MDDGSQLLKALNVLMLKILVSVPMMFTYLLQLIVYQKIKVQFVSSDRDITNYW